MTRSQTVLLVIMVILVPALLFANAWQSYRTYQLGRTIRSVQAEQARLLEENTRLVVGIASLRSPGRIRQIASEQLGMQNIASSQILTIQINTRGGDYGR